MTEGMSTLLICLAIAFLTAGVAIAFAPSSGSHRVTIKNEGSVVTVRSAGLGDITVTFDPSDLKGEEPPIDLVPGEEAFAENEPTIVEEFTDPRTTIERKREIARTFDGLKCRFIIEDNPVRTPGPSSTASWEDEGTDECFEEPVPEDYYEE